jgi:hypothetical protein
MSMFRLPSTVRRGGVVILRTVARVARA